MEKIKVQCAVCGQFEIEENEWDGITRDIIRTSEYSHGYCPSCFKSEQERIDAFFNEFNEKEL